MKKLFPEFLNKGAGNRAANLFLQQLLWARFPKDCEAAGLIADGDYGNATGQVIKELQERWELKDQDENFGPETRAELKRRHHIDVDVIPASPEAAGAPTPGEPPPPPEETGN